MKRNICFLLAATMSSAVFGHGYIIDSRFQIPDSISIKAAEIEAAALEVWLPGGKGSRPGLSSRPQRG